MSFLIIFGLYAGILFIVASLLWHSLTAVRFLTHLFLERKRSLELRRLRTIQRPKGYTPVITLK